VGQIYKVAVSFTGVQTAQIMPRSKGVILKIRAFKLVLVNDATVATRSFTMRMTDGTTVSQIDYYHNSTAGQTNQYGMSHFSNISMTRNVTVYGEATQHFVVGGDFYLEFSLVNGVAGDVVSGGVLVEECIEGESG